MEEILNLLPEVWKVWANELYLDIAPHLVQAWDWFVRAGAIIGSAAVLAAAIPGEMDDKAVSGVRRYYNKVYNILRKVVDIVGANVKNAANQEKPK